MVSHGHLEFNSLEFYSRVFVLVLCSLLHHTQFYQNRIMFHWNRVILISQFSIWRSSAIFNFQFKVCGIWPDCCKIFLRCTKFCESRTDRHIVIASHLPTPWGLNKPIERKKCLHAWNSSVIDNEFVVYMPNMRPQTVEEMFVQSVVKCEHLSLSASPPSPFPIEML